MFKGLYKKQNLKDPIVKALKNTSKILSNLLLIQYISETLCESVEHFSFVFNAKNSIRATIQAILVLKPLDSIKFDTK